MATRAEIKDCYTVDFCRTTGYLSFRDMLVHTFEFEVSQMALSEDEMLALALKSYSEHLQAMSNELTVDLTKRSVLGVEYSTEESYTVAVMVFYNRTRLRTGGRIHNVMKNLGFELSSPGSYKRKLKVLSTNSVGYCWETLIVTFFPAENECVSVDWQFVKNEYTNQLLRSLHTLQALEIE